jgi:glycosyltransferase involved in cell wall biosynthesis
MSANRVTAIVPAYNEERTIAGVLAVLTASPVLDEILVVDDGSTDRTVEVVGANFPQVQVISREKNGGKGGALWIGALFAKNPVLFFCDADLLGLTAFHIADLVDPVVKGRVRMVAGVQEMMAAWRWGRKLDPSLKEPAWISGSDPFSEFMKGLGGEKVLLRQDFLLIPGIEGSGYEVEHLIINYFKENGLPLEYLVLRGVGHVWKLDKWGIVGGLPKELKAFAILGWQYLTRFKE